MSYIFTNNQECSSGCESGWTMYLDHSSISPCNDQEHDYVGKSINRSSIDKRLVKGDQGYQEEEEEEEETDDEDLSMVSDASSGPPHFLEEEGYYGNESFYNNTIDASSPARNRRKTNENRHPKVKDQSTLDDTASSPMFDYSNKKYNLNISQPVGISGDSMEEYSQGYSTTQFEVTPRYTEHYDFFQPSISGNQLQQNQWFEGKRW